MNRAMLGGIALAIVGGGVSSTYATHSAATASCNVQGVWRVEKAITNGKTDSTSAVEVKLVTKHHFAWVAQENRRDTLPLKTFRDTTRVYSDAGGYGTYTVSGNKYTEHIEVFPNPDYVGKDWPATCQVNGNQWIHSWIGPEYKDPTGRTRRDTVAEYYRRVE